MKKLSFITILFAFTITFSISAEAVRMKIVEDIPWRLEYSINKYGEREKIIGAECGKWGMDQKIYIDEKGMVISFRNGVYSNFDSEVKSISFLFDSKKELVIEEAFEVSIDKYNYGKAYFISRENAKYKEMISNIKKSNHMSILVEEENGYEEKMVEVSNKNATTVLNKLENILK